jgi:hypothetical protein
MDWVRVRLPLRDPGIPQRDPTRVATKTSGIQQSLEKTWFKVSEKSPKHFLSHEKNMKKIGIPATWWIIPLSFCKVD